MPVVAQRCNFAIGDIIDNRFQISKVLGEGSFGKVYAVKDYSGNLQALKLLKLWEVPSDIRESLMTRFDMEFETGRINSDYLVHSISHGVVEGNPYIVMEYCPGGDLLSAASQSHLDLAEVATHVLCGLKALHNCGKVHRDLKPENVLVKKNGEFALTDFGISGDRNKRMTERNILGKPKQIFGTYAYMPPEQLNPRKDATVLPTTDIFSFGVMMYQLITGDLPFGRLDSERDLIQYLRKGKNGDWDRYLLLDTAEGGDWCKLIEGCLIPDFQNRLQDADEVLALVPQMQRVRPRIVEEQRDFQTRIINGVLLRIMQGEDYGKVYKLDDMLRGESAILSMGRKDDGVYNDIAIVEENSSYISRKHCTLELDYDIGSWVIRDGQWDRYDTGGWRKSTNGTYVNSKEVSINGLPFSPGDIISIGDTKLRVEAY
ncbi:protein kinase domain-containing protein [Phocaeicola sartorii]|uniref:protein kinase domain-containing protein n=1 Tax=Phocaeicola sartorii TaxID=671267 RepID=UPI0035134547